MKRTIYACILGLLAFGISSCGDSNDPNNPNANQGVLPGSFSVSISELIQFSQGNLQYNQSLKEWRFAIHQWDYVGDSQQGTVYENDKKCNNGYIAVASYKGWVDLFGWGTGLMPMSFSTEDNFYKDFHDWGQNAIINGGNIAGEWFTLTDKQWDYIFKRRPHATELRGFGTVNGVPGLILLPDLWIKPNGFTFVSSDATNDAAGWDANQYNAKQWGVMEKAGAVFFPAAGMRKGVNVSNIKEAGFYWTGDVETARFVGFDLQEMLKLPSQPAESPSNGLSVRLVKYE